MGGGGVVGGRVVCVERVSALVRKGHYITSVNKNFTVNLPWTLRNETKDSHLSLVNLILF